MRHARAEATFLHTREDSTQDDWTLDTFLVYGSEKQGKGNSGSFYDGLVVKIERHSDSVLRCGSRDSHPDC